MSTASKAKRALLSFAANRNWVKKAFYTTIHTQPLAALYKAAYTPAVNRKLARFRLSDLTVSIETFNGCNARCTMCPYIRMTRPKEYMSEELFKKIVDDCKGNGISNVNLNFYNEPFLDRFIFDRIRYLKEQGFQTKLYSNASVLDASKLDTLIASGLDVLNFSIDGYSKEVYEKIRRGLSHEKMLANVTGLLAERAKRGITKPEINVVFVRQNGNYHEAEDFKRFWEPKVDHVYFSLDDNRDDDAKFLPALATKPSRISYPCHRLWSELVVMSNGQVPLCCIDFDGSLVLGDFKTQTLKDVWESPRFRKIREMHLAYKADQIPNCKSCLHPHRMNARSWW